jgi:hypothetical protein
VRPYLQKAHHKKSAGGVAQGEGLEFKPQYCKKREKNPLISQEMILIFLSYMLKR